MTDFFLEMLQYNEDSNKRLIFIMEENMDRLSEKVCFTLSHILNAHHVWNNRILNLPIEFEVWENHPIEFFRPLDEKNHEVTKDILGKYHFEHIVEYKNAHGDIFSDSLRDIIFHIVNHSTYHRGQVSRLLRDEINDSISTDFIFYKRHH